MPSEAASPVEASRRHIAAILGYSVLFLAPLLLALIALGVKFPGLRTPLAMEHADTARRLARGEGFTTSSLRPLSLELRPDGRRHPDLYHAPAHPLVLAAAFKIVRPSDKAASAAGLILWVCTVPLTFLLARRGFGTRVAVLAAALYLCSVAMLQGSLCGLPYPLSALGLLAVAWLAAPDPREGTAESRPASSPARLALAGAAMGLSTLTHYGLFFLAPAVAAYVAMARLRRGRALLLFAAGFAAALAPWMILNLARGFSPFFSLYWYEALAGTDSYPGDLVWRAASAENPVVFLLLHPLQVARKFVRGLALFWNEGFILAHPVILMLSAAALVARGTPPRWRGWLAALAAGLVLCAAGSCLLRPEPGLLLAASPLLAIAAAAFASDWIGRWTEELSMRPLWESRWVGLVFRKPDRLRGAIRFSLAAGILLVSAFPLLLFLGAPQASPTPEAAAGADLGRLLGRDGAVVTDRPEFVAWHADRRALWLFLDERKWDHFEERCGPIAASYVTPAVASVAPRHQGLWWWWLASPRGAYRKLVPADPMPPHGVLRVRRDRG